MNEDHIFFAQTFEDIINALARDASAIGDFHGCGIVVAEQSIREGQQVLRTVVRDIEHRFHITHTTVQVEVEGCAADDMYCRGRARQET